MKPGDWKKIGIKNMVLLLIAGVLLLLCTLPDVFRGDSDVQSGVQLQENITSAGTSVPVLTEEERLEEILSKIEGVGTTKVMIFYGSDGKQEPQGVVIVAEGAKKAEVIQYISDATEALFGLPKHKIIVLPMRTENGRD